MFTLSRRTAGLLSGILFAALLIGACSLDPTALSRDALSAAAADARCYTCDDPAPTPDPSPVGSASGFVILGGPAVTLTGSVVTGDVGTGFPGAPVTQTGGSVAGIVHLGDAISIAAYKAIFDDGLVYDTVGATVTSPTNMLLAAYTGVNLSLSPGVYYTEAALTFTTVTLTLDAAGDPNATWTFLVGTDGTGAFTGTDFSIVLAGGAEACNVTWWVAEGVTMTRANFQGTILAGAANKADPVGGAITFTGPGTLVGRAFAKAAVTVSYMSPFKLCDGALPGGGSGGHGKPDKYGDRVTGGGWIKLESRGKGTFSVSGGIRNGAPQGQLEYEDQGYRGGWGHRNSDKIKVKGTGVTQYAMVSDVTRHIEGTAKFNGEAGFTYKVDVSDNGEGRRSMRDTFAISVYDSAAVLVYSASGALEGGNIQVHNANGRSGYGWGRGW